jgi:hypothetical protein
LAHAPISCPYDIHPASHAQISATAKMLTFNAVLAEAHDDGGGGGGGRMAVKRME